MTYPSTLIATLPSGAISGYTFSSVTLYRNFSAVPSAM